MAEYERLVLRSKRERIISSLYEMTSNVTKESGITSNQGIAAHAAITLLNMGLSKYDIPELDSNAKISLSNEDVEMIESMALLAENLRIQKGRERIRETDQFIERLVEKTVTNRSTENQNLHERAIDQSRKDKKPLSIMLLASNLKRMSLKMRSFFEFQYGVIHILTWKNQLKTLFSLVLYTCICLWPHLAMCFPFLFLLFGVILPNYLKRHPLPVIEILPVKKRGQSFFLFLSGTQNSSLLTDLLSADSHHLEQITLASSNQLSVDYVEPSASDPLEFRSHSGIIPNVTENLLKKDSSKVVTSQLSFLMNMRDLQDLTSNVLEAIEDTENMATDLLSFKNERISTAIFYVLIVLTLIVFFLGQFIPWRLFFIFAGWVILGAFHPGLKDAVTAIKKVKEGAMKNSTLSSGGDNSKEANNSANSENPHVVVPEPRRTPVPSFYEFSSIIVDGDPETKIAEIYELQTKDIFKHEWTLFGYSKRIYDWKDPVRISRKLPQSVDHLQKVLPPTEWKYDFGYASNWFIDTDPASLIKERRLDKRHLRIRDHDAEQGWIYDDIPVEQDNVKEFRRRRIYRTCYRYARPVQKITVA